MAEVPARRGTDNPGEVHYQDREIDWRKLPRPVLIVLGYGMLGALSALGSFSYWAISDRIGKIEASISDDRGRAIAQAADDAGYAKRRAEQQEEIISDFQEQLRRLSREQAATRAEVAEVKRLLQKGR